MLNAPFGGGLVRYQATEFQSINCQKYVERFTSEDMWFLSFSLIYLEVSGTWDTIVSVWASGANESVIY